MTYNPNDVNTWGGFSPLIIAHDVGRSRDCSTAVVGGNSPFGQRLLGICAAEELPQGLFGSPRASALAAVDRRYNHNALIVADLSNDASYADVLLETFGQRVIGTQISRHGDGMNAEHRACGRGHLPVYTVARSYLIELFHRELQAERVRIVHGPGTSKAFEQLVKPDVEYRKGGTVYTCPAGGHDDLGVSMAMRRGRPATRICRTAQGQVESGQRVEVNDASGRGFRAGIADRMRHVCGVA
jgi:hypothetical protein